MTFAEAKGQIAHLYDEHECREILLRLTEHVTHLSRSAILGERDFGITPHQQQFDEAVLRLRKGEPLQYILGYEEFCDRRFIVNPSVLIPRPETQDLVAWVEEDFSTSSSPLILDACTGSGCIAISLALDLTSSSVCACDLSLPALDVARLNAKQLHANVSFFQADVLQMSDTELPFFPRVIVSNPPYVRQSEQKDMQPVVLKHEPAQALFVPDSDPLVFYRALGNLALRACATLYVEINSALSTETIRLFHSQGFSSVSLRHDRFDAPRMIRATPPTNK